MIQAKIVSLRSKNLTKNSKPTKLGKDSKSEEQEFDKEFKVNNTWHCSTLDRCKCGKFSLMEKTIKSFCCHEKALEYNKYDEKLCAAQNQGFKCMTNVSSFVHFNQG